MVEVSDEEGEFLVRKAREVIEKLVLNGERIKEVNGEYKILNEMRGVFVTINKLREHKKELRGCIGFPLPYHPLKKGLAEAAIAAASEDPRFEPLKAIELPKIVVEVSILTEPKLIEVKSPKEYPSKIKIGRDGLVVKWAYGSGLLLPQVPVEYNWDAEEYLSHACLKAGAPPDAWLMPETKIYSFQAEVFEELEPKGKVIRKKLEES